MWRDPVRGEIVVIAERFGVGHVGATDGSPALPPMAGDLPRRAARISSSFFTFDHGGSVH